MSIPWERRCFSGFFSPAARPSWVISPTAWLAPESLLMKEKAESAARIVALATWDTSAPAATSSTTSRHLCVRLSAVLGTQAAVVQAKYAPRVTPCLFTVCSWEDHRLYLSCIPSLMSFKRAFAFWATSAGGMVFPSPISIRIWKRMGVFVLLLISSNLGMMSPKS